MVKKKDKKDMPVSEPPKENIIEQMFMGGNDVRDNETDRDKVVKEWLDDKYIETKTELNQMQIYAVTILETLANQWNITPLKKLIANFRKNQLSKDRGTSKELVDILKNRDSNEFNSVKKWGEYLK